jgi:hypothetical protein
MRTFKWILAGLSPAFVTGGAILARNPHPDFLFWWSVLAAAVGGWAGMGINKAIDTRSGE